MKDKKAAPKAADLKKEVSELSEHIKKASEIYQQLKKELGKLDLKITSIWRQRKKRKEILKEIERLKKELFNQDTTT
jgi:predicted RNase H-like nuclease (RuvC/YqgF family)